MNPPAMISGYSSVLEWGRRRTGLAVQTALRGGSLYLGRLSGVIALCDQGVVSVTSFATGVVVGRICGKAELGVFTLAWTSITMATGMMTALLATPYTVFSPQMSRPRRRRYLGSLLVHHGLFSLLIALTVEVWAGAGLWLGILRGETWSIFAITAAVFVFTSLREFIRNVCFAELKMGWALLVDLTACFIHAAGILVLLHFDKLAVQGTLTVIGVASAVVTSGWLILDRGAFRAEPKLFARDLKRNWGIAKWVLGSGMLWQCSSYLFPLMLTAFHGTSTTGTWAASSAIVALGSPVLLGLSNYVLPKISNIYAAAGIDAMGRHVHRSSLLFTALLLPLVLFLAVFGERLLTAVYGSSYAGTANVVTLLAANLLVVTAARPYAQGLFTLDCAKADTLVNSAWVCLLFVMGIPLIKSAGLEGAAAAMFATSAVAWIIKILVFRAEIRRRSEAFGKTANDLAASETEKHASGIARGVLSKGNQNA